MSSETIDSSLTAGRQVPSVSPWLARAGRLSWFIAVPAITAFAVHEVLAGKLSGAVLDLYRASLLWIAAAIAFEVLSYLMYAAAQRRLIGPRGLGTPWLASLAVCAQGVSNFVPAGYVAANLLNFRELRRKGLAAPASAWLLLTSSALYIGALALLTLIAAEIADGRGGTSLDGARIGAGAVLVALPAAGLAARYLLKRGTIRLPRAWRESREHAHASGSVVASAAILFTASWLADAGCLVMAVHAVGGQPAWSLVPIAYCAAQLVSFLPITPGGLGLVEGSLTVSLISGGSGAGSVLAAILLYRIISYWGTLPFGLIGYLAVRRGRLAGRTSQDGGDDSSPALGDRALGGDRPVFVLEG